MKEIQHHDLEKEMLGIWESDEMSSFYDARALNKAIPVLLNRILKLDDRCRLLGIELSKIRNELGMSEENDKD